MNENRYALRMPGALRARILVPLFILIIMLALLAVLPASAEILPGADTGGRPLEATMTGAAEAPGPGDPDGIGHVQLTLNEGQGEICFEITVSGIAPAFAAHIHIAPAGVPGPIVVPLAPPTSGSSTGCVAVDPELIKAIRQNPENYYVNVHNAGFPAGALRGQLSK